MQLAITLTSTATTDLAASLAAGTAQVHSVREDGTTRRRHFLTGKELEHALWVRLQREGQEADEAEGVPAVTPRSMGSIARELHISVSAVRRVLIDLAITEEIEELEAEELADLIIGSADSE
jgi:hypothetical protein